MHSWLGNAQQCCTATTEHNTHIQRGDVGTWSTESSPSLQHGAATPTLHTVGGGKELP